MREHMGLYHGKRKIDGEWVEGCLFIDDKREKCEILVGYVNYRISWEVNPDTVGECTGLPDKNGKLIFEGDILKITWTAPGRKPVSEVHCVTYRKGGFYTESNGQFRGLVSNYVRGSGGIFTEIIGTIHDNPELLQQEE